MVRAVSVLAIDFGTSNTAAMVRRPDGRGEPLLFDGSPLLPSAVFVLPDGTLIVGRDAVHSARLAPERFEPNPKLRVDDGTVLLGVEVPVAELFAAVLRRVAQEAGTAETRDLVVLTHPAGWGSTRRAVLAASAGLAGLDQVRLVPEPVAAVAGLDDATAGPVVVYDLGAGTFDVSVVVDGVVAGADGLADVGGLDVDTALVEYLQATYVQHDPAAWQRLQRPATADDRRAWRQLTDDVRSAKEMLSRSPQTFVHVPLVGVDAPITREQVEAVAKPLIARTVAATEATIAAAGPDGRAHRVHLVGGGSRMPMVATMLHRRLGTVPVLAEQPELVVARGALNAFATDSVAVPDPVPEPVAVEVPDLVEPSGVDALPPVTFRKPLGASIAEAAREVLKRPLTWVGIIGLIVALVLPNTLAAVSGDALHYVKYIWSTGTVLYLAVALLTEENIVLTLAADRLTVTTRTAIGVFGKTATVHWRDIDAVRIERGTITFRYRDGVQPADTSPRNWPTRANGDEFWLSLAPITTDEDELQRIKSAVSRYAGERYELA